MATPSGAPPTPPAGSAATQSAAGPAASPGGPSALPLLVPSPAGTARYVLLDEVARGGMGVVYRATDAVLDREVAVKVLRDGLDDRSGAAHRFLDEARIAGQLQHPGIPAVHDLGTLPDGRPFLAMKLVRGQTLDELLKKRADPGEERGSFLAVFEQVCQAVGYAHSHGVIHRDLKPANVMVGAFGEVQVMDWGLAKVLGPRAAASADDPGATTGTAIRSVRDGDGSETQAGSVLGTLAFMPPEQALGAVGRVGVRSDVFGLGAILAVVLTGRPPFDSGSVETVRVRAAQGRLEDCFARLDACGAEPELVALCKRCLSPEPADRPPDGGAVAGAVAAFRATADERARQAELERVRAAEERKRRRVQRTLAVSVLGLAAAAAFGVVLALFWQGAEAAKEAAESARGSEEQARQAAEAARDAEKAAREDAQRAKANAEVARERFERSEYGRTMEVAHREWRDNNVSAALSLLAGVRRELRGWEWHYIHRLCHSDLLTLKGHTFSVLSASYSPDGTRIVTASQDKTAKVRDARTGAEIVTLRGHTAPVESASFSPDGRRVVTASRDRTARVWDAKTGAETLTLKGHTDAVLSASFSADGRRVVTASGDQTARVWDAKAGVQSLALRGHRAIVRSAEFSHDGTRLVTTGDDRTARLWDARIGSEDLTLRGHTDHVYSASFSPDGSRVVTASRDRTARVWDAKTGDEALTLRGHTNAVRSASFSPDGTRIVTASWDYTAKVWDAKTGNAESLVLTGKGFMFSATFSPDGERVVTVGDVSKVRVWDAATGTVGPRALGGRVIGAYTASFSKDGTRLLTTGGNVTAWDAKTGAASVTLRGQYADYVRSASFSPDGRHIVTTRVGITDHDTTARVWDARTGAEILALRGHTDIVNSASFSPDGTRIVTASRDRTARVWDARTGAEDLALRGHTHDVGSASFSPDGTRIVTASWDRTARVWDARNGAEVFVLQGHTSVVSSASFSPDGTRIVTAGVDDTARVWDTRSGAETLALRGHTGMVYSASFSPDGTRVVTASADGTARVWDARPPHPGWRLEWGDALLARGDRDGALAEYREAIRLDPQDADARARLGAALQGEEDFEGAVAAYREALRLDPKQALALANLPPAEHLRDLLGRLPSVLAGRAEPRSPAEACELAELCGRPSRRRYADAVRLSERAFAAEPALAEDSAGQRRYAAACYAARAANGEGAGAPAGPHERAVLRARALAWLRSDLTLLRLKAGSDRPGERQRVVGQLSRWMEDESLAETYPGARREGWTEEEAKAWDRLWSAASQTLAVAQKP